LSQVFHALSDAPQPAEELRSGSRLSEEEFDKALEKLEIHGGARMDFGGNVQRGGAGWKKTYAVQAQYRAEQFAKVLRFTEQNDCRMSALVRHFGDVEDADALCGVCDVCDPGAAVLRLFRRATHAENNLASRIAAELRGVDYKAAGTLQRSIDAASAMSRDEFDNLLGAMVRARLIEIEDAEYEKDGEVRRFRKVRLTESAQARRVNEPFELLISAGILEEFAERTVAPARARKATQRTSAAMVAGGAGSTRELISPVVQLSGEDQALAGRIIAWRSAEAKRLKVPAYVVLHDRTVNVLATVRPRNPKELLGIDGIGPAKVERFGADLLRICGE
jgi:superfamily II DNA helicase RecQ